MENKVDANNPLLNIILYCANFEKEHQESIENGIKDQKTAEKVVTKKTNGERLEPFEAQAIHRIKKNFADVFDSNNQGLIEPTEEDKQQMDAISIEEVGQYLQNYKYYLLKAKQKYASLST
jgi:hypothetical protein